jgi:hypothetical protein
MSSRRRFLGRAAAGAAGLWAGPAVLALASECDLAITGAPWPSPDGWERRTVMHFLNTIVPGDDGRPLFPGDTHPLSSGGDVSAGAWSACALDVFYDPYYGVAGANSRLLATLLELLTRLKHEGRHFYEVSQAGQLEIVDAAVRVPRGQYVVRLAALAMSAALGAARNGSFTTVIGWPGPNGGYYDESRHPRSRWRQPVRITTDGNLP